MLRLQLLECLRALAIQVEQQQRQSEEADFGQIGHHRRPSQLAPIAQNNGRTG
jgi:hypothetical protein